MAFTLAAERKAVTCSWFFRSAVEKAISDLIAFFLLKDKIIRFRSLFFCSWFFSTDETSDFVASLL